MTDKTLLQRYTHILIVVSCYWFVSITLVFVNKDLLRFVGQGLYYVMSCCVSDQVIPLVVEQHGGVGREHGLRQGEAAGYEE